MKKTSIWLATLLLVGALSMRWCVVHVHYPAGPTTDFTWVEESGFHDNVTISVRCDTHTAWYRFSRVSSRFRPPNSFVPEYQSGTGDLPLSDTMAFLTGVRSLARAGHSHSEERPRYGLYLGDLHLVFSQKELSPSCARIVDYVYAGPLRFIFARDRPLVTDTSLLP